MLRRIWLILLAISVAGGCASQKRSPTPSPSTRGSTTQRAADDPAGLTLDQIQPRPVLERPVATAPTTRPSLDALQLFAEARAAILEGQRFTAISLLEKARLLDPQSFEICYALAQAHQGNSVTNDKSIELLKEASRLNPDHLLVQSQLGRQYLAKGDLPRAIERLRLATLTSEYTSDDDGAAVADYFLARALQQKGYDRAALDRYAMLLQRLESPSFTIRSNPELGYLINRPELLYVQIGQLHQKHGDYEAALRIFRLAVQRDPSNFDLQKQVVLATLAAGDRAVATQRASEIVSSFRASTESLDLLREVYADAGGEAAVVRVLEDLHKQKPEDRAILFTLVELLRNTSRGIDAEQLLADSLRTSPREKDKELVGKLMALKLDRDDVIGATRLLVDTIARRPDLVSELDPLWADLMRSGRKNRLRLSALQNLQVPSESEAAKLYLISRMAQAWNRDLLARSSIEKATKLSPAFPPAFRGAVADIWQRPDFDLTQRRDASDALIKSVEAGGHAALAAELRGLVAITQSDMENGVRQLEQAIQLGSKDPETQLAHADALRSKGDSNRFEQALWKLISDRPTFDDAYERLFAFYDENADKSRGERLLSTWLGNDPGSVSARILQASVLIRRNQAAGAERILLSLFADHADNESVVALLNILYVRTDRAEQFTRKLEDEIIAHPRNRTAVESLVRHYTEVDDAPAALRVLDATRQSIDNDPDLLYDVANLYAAVDRKETYETILEKVIELDPRHPPANNDLGYTWADQGKNLDRAEAMCRVAVEAEPDNQSYLDSLGWVLYKRSRFDESRVYFERAIGPSARPDPVVLDHMGDVLYRLGNLPEATRQWQHAKRRLGEMQSGRLDLQNLRAVLDKKLRQAQGKQPVEVAPVTDVPVIPGRVQSES